MSRVVQPVRLAAAFATLAMPLVLSGCGETVSAPKAFAEYHSKDGRFSCDYPKGWEADGAGTESSPSSWAKFTKGPAEIRIDADLAGSLMGDIQRSASERMGGEAEPPVASLHERGQKAMAEEYSKYEERDPKAVTCGLGEARRSTFIATGALGGKVYGYRATALSNDRRITVVCTCPASNWQALKPAFEKVIASLRR
ncbi:MAG: hypothetical protein U0835_25660 [Isosphaeraceae bacterium]